MNQDWLDQYKGVEYLKNKKERDWKFIIGMIVLLAIFAVMGGAFWNMVGKQAQMVREEEQKEEANAISAIYIETGEFLKTGVFVDLNNGTIFSADIPAEGIYNKKGKLISDDVLENGDKVKIYGDGIMLESFPTVSGRDKDPENRSSISRGNSGVRRSGNWNDEACSRSVRIRGD